MKPHVVDTSQEKFTIELLSNTQILDNLDTLRSLLLRAEPFYKPWMDFEDIVRFALNDVYQLWVASDCNGPFICLITEINIYPKKKVLRFLQVGGVVRKVMQFSHHLDIMERWGASVGCTHVEASVRSGLLPMLYRHGYEDLAIVVHKEITKLGRGN